jgi:Ni/Fe-hydrogenase subunit HybB-like protein
MNRMLARVASPWRVLGLLCLLAGAYATLLRFTRGLGGVTHLSDTFPWGLWVGFDVLCGVGLAAGGFTVSAIVYVLGLEKYRPIARPAVLTAFIGYLLVVGGLMFDLGHPWRIWHPIVMWNPHSVMFEVAWCVTLYTIVLTAEVSIMVFERLRWMRAAHIAHKATFPLTILAVLLSMLHQSSLGSLFLIVPGRLHELWYTPLLPLLFFTSAVAVGLSMVIFESNLSARAFGRALELEVQEGAAKLAAIFLSIYLIIRGADLVRRGALASLWPLDRAGVMFLIEIAVGFIIPIILFTHPRVRRNSRWLYHASQLMVLGFVINRLNVAVTGFEVVSGKSYVPAWTEIAVTLMLVTLGVTAFYLAARYLPVFERDPASRERFHTWRLAALNRGAMEPATAAGLRGIEGGEG